MAMQLARHKNVTICQRYRTVRVLLGYRMEVTPGSACGFILVLRHSFSVIFHFVLYGSKERNVRILERIFIEAWLFYIDFLMFVTLHIFFNVTYKYRYVYVRLSLMKDDVTNN